MYFVVNTFAPKMTSHTNLSQPGGCSLIVTLIIALNCIAAAAPPPGPVRERLSLDYGWRFTKGDPPLAGAALSYTSIKPWMNATGNEFVKDGTPATRPPGNPGGDVAYTRPDFDDSGWQQLNLPHDWGIAGPFDPQLPGPTGRLPWAGVGWYRKQFSLPPSDSGRKICLAVDGAMSYANVWVNGQYAGGWPYGYSSWELDITPFVRFGADNVVAVRLDNPPDSSRWYPGGGIYRNVWLVKTGPVHVAHWGTYITTPQTGPSGATVNIQVAVENDSGADAVVSVRNEIFKLAADGRKGRSVGTLTTDGLNVAAGRTATDEQQISFRNPRLWSLKDPRRYIAVTSIFQDGKLADSYETPFGIRTIQFDPDKGFFLNGSHVELNGVCGHADVGALGTVVNVRALQRQIQVLQAMGCNAIRTSHNPPAPELLDLCDRMGMLVMDESFDCWETGKRPNDYHLLFDDWHEKDWRAELRRDRNHPCVILWSIGNEIPDQKTEAGCRLAGELTLIAHEEDPTRPTTAACDKLQSGYDGFQTNLDVFGYNYKPHEYGRFHQANPDQPLFGSETASCVSSRGEYDFPVSWGRLAGQSKFQVSSYDVYWPPWATSPDAEFQAENESPVVAGQFVWTGFDYLGEPTPYGKPDDPARSSYFGIVDLAGFTKDRFYLYQSVWRPDLPMAHIVPQCWNWPDRIGQITPVYVYTSGDSAELFLNGKSLGLRKKDQHEYRIWDPVKYEPGTLKVVAYRNGRKWATDEVQTTGPAAKLVLQADRGRICGDGQDLSYVTVRVEDKDGLVAPLADNAIHFEITGPGEIAATDNGDPTDLVSFPSPDRKAFNGLALAIVRAASPGTIILSASSPGLVTATVKISGRALTP